MQCMAHLVLNPESTLEERRCTKEAGDYVVDAHDGTRHLYSSHADSYKKVGFELRRIAPHSQSVPAVNESEKTCEANTDTLVKDS
jgi:hypothetical protein